MSNSYAECYPVFHVREKIFLFFFLFNNNSHIYLFLINFIFGYAGSFCCVWVFSSCDERGYSLVAVAFPVVELRFNSWDTQL